MGIVLISHIEEIAKGLRKLLLEFSNNIDITYAKVESGNVGTTFESVENAIVENKDNEVFVFYDLGSSKMNAELAKNMISEKVIHILDVAMIEGSFVALNLMNSGLKSEDIIEKLSSYVVEK